MNIYSNHNRNHEQSMKLQPPKQVDREATAWVVVPMHRASPRLYFALDLRPIHVRGERTRLA